MRRKTQADINLDKLATFLLDGAWIRELYFEGKSLKWKVLLIDNKPKPKG